MATLDEKRRYRTYLRRLSHRSEQHPSAFQLSSVEILPQDSKLCSHSKLGSQNSTEGGFGKVRRAKWSKSDGTVVMVAIKILLVSQQLFVVSSSGIESILV